MMDINITAPFCSTSYGMVALNVVKELTNLGHKVSAFPIGGIDGNDVPIQFHESLGQSLNNAQYFNPDAPSVRIYHQFDLAQHIGRGKRVGWPIFELDKFSDLELHHLKAQDELIVCSRWAKEVIENNITTAGVELPVKVVPLGVDNTIFFPAQFKEKNGPTRFINIGKKELRKGHDFILECFEKAFNLDDNVELWMVWGNRILNYKNEQESASWTNMYAKSPMKNKIFQQWHIDHQNNIVKKTNYTWDQYKDELSKNQVNEWVPSQNHVAKLLQSADCGIFPSRAEGWNLDLLEAMACGLPVITTNYSAHTEYISNENSYSIKGNGTETAFDGVWFFGQGDWLNIDDASKDGIVAQMQWIHQRKQSGDNLFNQAGVETAKKFTWKNTAETLLRVIQ
jgi:hypothetical protein